MKTQTKIAALFFLGSLSLIVLLSVSIYFFIIRYSLNDFYKRLEIRGIVTAKAQLDNEEAELPVLQEMREMHLEKLPEEKEFFYKILPNKNFETEANELEIPSSFFDDIIKKGNATYQKGDTFFAGIKYEGRQGVYAVIVSANNYYNSDHLSYLRTILLIAVLVASLLSLSMSILFSKQVFTPVKEIASRVREISSQSLHLRLESRLANDEIRELETTFNHMLDRLETAFETQKNFISNASHELGTPLTTIIGEVDVTLSKQRNVEEYTASLNVVLHEADRLEKITKSLLMLAQTGFNGKVQTLEWIRVDQLLWDVKNTMEKINPKNKVQINLTLMPENPEKLRIKGNEQLLHIAISNVVSNGCKYSGYKPVTVSLGTSNDRVIIVVKDSSIGIPKADIPFIYDPFFRASNSKQYEGYGIGLPLARNIIRMHKGELDVTSTQNEGTIVQFSLPYDLQNFA